MKNLPAMQGGRGLIPELGRSPGEGKGYPPEYSGLENSMDYESDTTEQLALSLSIAEGVDSILGRQDKIPHTSQPKKPKHKQKQCCNKSNKDFRNGPHPKKKIFKKKTNGI